MFEEIKNRDAWSTLRGFVYQVDITILRWLELGDNEILELEKGEDIDIVTRDFKGNEVSRELEQIKYRESNISLNQEITIEILFNFFIHRNNNPNHKIYFRFVTNTNYAIERPELFLNGKSGIEVWTELRQSSNISKADKRFIILKSHLLKKLNDNIIEYSKLNTEAEIGNQINLLDFISYIDIDENLIQFISDFEWSIGNEDHNQINESIKRKLIDSEIVNDFNQANLLYSRLFLFVFKLLCNKSLKSIDKKELQKQTSFQELNSSDQNILSLINELLLNLNTRVNELEKNVEIQNAQISTLVNDIKLINNSDTVFDFRLQNISVNPPSLIKNGTLRKEKVYEIKSFFEKCSWIHFQGINGTGKSQLASLVCTEYKSRWWLDLRAYNQSAEKTTLLIEKFLSTITKCPIINNRKIWAKNVLKSFPENTIIVFNDLPKVEKDSALSELLTHLSGNNIKLLTTSNFKIPSNFKQLLKTDILQEYNSFDFTDSEIIECLVNNDAIESVVKYINLISAISHRNPQIVSAIIHRLKSINWGQGSKDLFDIIFNKEFSNELLGDAQLSIKNYIQDEKSRELLYRLSLIHWNFKHKEFRAISDVEEKIAHPNEKLTDLLSIWIQEQDDSFQVSPLIYDIGKFNLSPEVIQNVHLAIAKSIISAKKLDQISASRGISSFLQGGDFNNAGFILLNLYFSAKTKEEINTLNSWGYLNYWSELDIPKEMSVVLRSYIRNEQIRLNRSIGNDPNIFYSRLSEYLKEDTITISQSLLVHFISLINMELSPNLTSFWEHIDYGLSNWKQIEKPFKEIINGEIFTGLLWHPIYFLVTKKDVELWLDHIKLLESEFNVDFFNNEIAETAVTIISSKIANSENQKEEKNWELVTSCLYILIEFFKNRNLEILEIIVLKEIICFEFNISKNQINAEKITIETASKASTNEAKYLLFENIGKLYFNDKNIEKSKEWLFQALELNCTSQTNYIDTLIYGAAAISESDSRMAVELCVKANNLAEHRKEYLELDYLQVLGELGIAYWINGDFKQSFESFEKVVDSLMKIKKEKFGKDWIRLFTWTGHSLGYISATVSKDSAPQNLSDGGEYVKPYQGILSFNTKDLTDLYLDKNDPIILAQLAIFSDGINDIENAYKWSLRAFDLARKNVDQKIFIMISSVCSQYSLINFKIEEAFETYLLFASVSSHLTGNPKERQEKLGEIVLTDLLSEKPSENWNSAEDTTVLYAIIPIFIMVLNSHLQNDVNKNERSKQFETMIKNYIPKASNKKLWEQILELTSRIINKNISENELTTRGNEFGELDLKNLQIICNIGFIYSSKDSSKQLKQIINIFPYLTKLLGSTQSVIKFVLFPFAKNRCLNILRDSFFGNKKELEEIINDIETLNISDKNAIQLLLQPIVKSLELNIIDNRKPWLYEYKEI